jgi:hypothetical protein
VVAVYFGAVAIIGELFHTQFPTGRGGGVIAIVVAAFLFQPLRDWIQARLDRFFYRDRFNYRHTLVEFGRTLANEVRIEPMLGSVLDRISQTLLVDRMAIFLENTGHPGTFHIGRSMGVQFREPLDLALLNAEKFAGRNYLFFESPRAAVGLDDSARATLEQLGLNYFIPCRVRDRVVAIIGLGKTVDGDFLSSDDVELLETIAGYLGIAIDNARLYHSLEAKSRAD